VVVARETTLQELLEGSKQYQVPLYQRTYSWTKAQMQRLWDDVVKLAADRAEDAEATHFIGSLVLAPSPANGPAGVSEFLVVDGQQRLTTLSILLCAIRDHRAAHEDPEHRDRLNEQYLINKWKGAQQRLKLLPTQADRASYIACLDSTPQAGGSDPVGTAYRFFAAQLVDADDLDDPLDIERIENAVISGLSVVSVTAHKGDNVHRIFESLNNTGLKLTQGDLLRNYLFMRLPSRGEAVYQSLWLPLQNTLSSGELEMLFWLDLVQQDARIKQTDIYAAHQARLDRLRSEAQIEAEIARFGRLGTLLRKILHPEDEADVDVRRRLKRLSAWGTTTVYPLLLHLLDRRDHQTATSEQIAGAMLYVESFFVRRLLIGRATANINRILLSVVTEMSKELPVDEAVRTYLSTGRKYFANDTAVRSAVRSIPYYLNGRPHQRSLVLQWLEESYGSKEPVTPDMLTIEHVLPQTPTVAWQDALADELGPDEEFVQAHEALVHTLGNLTLTGYNAKLSNSPFDVKREQLVKSGISMNQEIAAADRWGRASIHARADALAERIVGIWPGPSSTAPGAESSVPWDVMTKALAELPAGSWTTYGDLAALIGSHPVPVGSRLMTVSVPNAHRVLQADGKLSPLFKWVEPARTDDPKELLEAEGVHFDDRGRADQAQRLNTDELAQLAGIDPVDLAGPLPGPRPGQDSSLRDRFLQQLADLQGPEITHATLGLIDAWCTTGGRLWYGTAASETSCFLQARDVGHESIWPATLYPSGKFEIVFQHLSVRAPFDDAGLREEFRTRLNEIPGVNIAAAKIALRPGFRLELLVSDDARKALIEVLSWFYRQAQLANASTVV
jgi:alkylated DNA nucleotide flippase Atl1